MAGARKRTGSRPPKKKSDPKTDKPEKHAGGAPKKVGDPKRRERILTALKLGASLETAARAAGIHYDTLNEWRKADPEFAEACDFARAEMEVAALAEIKRASQKGVWQAAAWRLERMMPEKYSLRKREPEAEKPTELRVNKQLLKPEIVPVDQTGRKVTVNKEEIKP